MVSMSARRVAENAPALPFIPAKLLDGTTAGCGLFQFTSLAATALGSFFRRLAARVGKAKAVTATARKIAVLFYNTLRHGAAYVDPGVDYYEERYRRRTLDNLRRRAESLGFQLVEAATIPSGVS